MSLFQIEQPGVLNLASAAGLTRLPIGLQRNRGAELNVFVRATASSLSRHPKYVGAVAFQRTGDPEAGEFNDAQVLARFGTTPEDLSGL